MLKNREMNTMEQISVSIFLIYFVQRETRLK